MRNIMAYPLEDNEVLVWLDQKLEAYLASDVCGGMDGVIINHLKELVAANPITTTDTTTAKD